MIDPATPPGADAAGPAPTQRTRKLPAPADDCPLCGSPGPHPTATAQGRTLRDCPRCRLVWVDPAEHPSPGEERDRYDEHENDPADPDYRAFLSRLADPLVAHLPPGSRGLDFGCGPGPALVRMLTGAGHPTVGWDPFYAPDDGLLDQRYDFVTATEVVEHFHDPAGSFALLDRLVRPGGWLGIMTALLTEEVELATWWYLRDPTHVCFYRPATLAWLARRFRWRLEERTDRMAIFRTTRRPGPGAPDTRDAPAS